MRFKRRHRLLKLVSADFDEPVIFPVQESQTPCVDIRVIRWRKSELIRLRPVSFLLSQGEFQSH
jgi:hypothetical protein